MPESPPTSPSLLACPECDLLLTRQPLPVGQAAHCPRCEALLYRQQAPHMQRPLALALSCLLVFLLVNVFPLISITIQGQTAQTTLFGTVMALHQDDMNLLAALVLFAAIVVPSIVLGGVLYVLLPLHFGQRLPAQGLVLMSIGELREWAMIEVFLLGALVAIGKLASVASLEAGVALWAMGVLIFLLAAMWASLDEEQVWQQLSD